MSTDDTIDTDFERRHGITALRSEAKAINHRLAAFFHDVDASWAYGLDSCTGEEIQAAFHRHHPDCGRFGITDFKAVSMIMRDLPEHWSGKQRAAVAYYLAPFAAYYLEEQ